MKNKISNLELSSIIYFITRSFLIGVTFNSLLKVMKQNSWLTSLFSIPIGISFILCTIYVINFEPSLEVNQKLNKLFNKNISSFLIIIISTIFLFLCALNFLNLCNFVQSQFLIRTPIYIIAIIFSLTAIYVVSKGLNTISRTTNILFYVSIIIFIIILLNLFPNINISSLKPFFYLNINDMVKGLNTFYAFHICPIFLLTIIPKDKIKTPKLKKAMLFSYIISIITILLALVITISTFGYKVAMLYEYPIFHILKHVTSFGSSIEGILVMQIIFDFFICHVLLIYFISSNFKYLTNTKNNNVWYIIISIVIIVTTLFFSRYSIYLDEFLKLIIPLIITILVTIIIIIICIKIKMSKNSF